MLAHYSWGACCDSWFLQAKKRVFEKERAQAQYGGSESVTWAAKRQDTRVDTFSLFTAHTIGPVEAASGPAD